MKQFSVSAACEIGCVRSNNEDMVLVGNKFIRNENYETTIPLDPISKKRYVFAIADGMGGHQAGEVASTDVLIDFDFFIYDLPERLSVSDFDEVVIEWLQSINRKIHLKGVSHPSLSDMGTTLVALVVYENRFFRLNCGDSRLYQLRNGRLTQLTTDHSLNTMMGESKHSNIITNCIGGGGGARVETSVSVVDVPPHLWISTISPITFSLAIYSCYAPMDSTIWLTTRLSAAC